MSLRCWNEHDGNNENKKKEQRERHRFSRGAEAALGARAERIINKNNDARELSASFTCSHLEAFNFNLIMNLLPGEILKERCWIFDTHVVVSLLMKILQENEKIADISAFKTVSLGATCNDTSFVCSY